MKSPTEITDMEALKAAMIERINNRDGDDAISAQDLVSNGQLAAKWEGLYCVEYATMEDIQEHHLDVLKQIDRRFASPQKLPTASAVPGRTRKPRSDSFKNFLAKEFGNYSSFTSSPGEWAKPFPQAGLTNNDLEDGRTGFVLHAAAPEPEGSFQIKPIFPPAWRNIYQYLPPELSDMVQNSLSLNEDTEHPSFHSVVFNAVGAGLGEGPCWDELHRITHVSLTSMLRHLHAFNIDVPVFGVLVNGNAVSIEVGWWEDTEDGLFIVCAPIVREGNKIYDSGESDFEEEIPYPGHLIWSLDDAAQLQDLTTLLDSLDKYTRGVFAQSVVDGLDATFTTLKQGKFLPWKWDGIVSEEIISGGKSPLEWPLDLEEADRTQTDIELRARKSSRPSLESQESGEFSTSPSTGRYDSLRGTERENSPSTAATSFKIENACTPVPGKVAQTPSPVRDGRVASYGQSPLRQRLDFRDDA